MKNKLLRDGLLWGGALWFIGYLLGFVFFALVPPALIGWFVMPIGMAMTIWVLLRYIRSESFSRSLYLGIIWAALAITLDYLFLVRLLKPDDGYYKPDVYLYYILTLALPPLVYSLRTARKKA